MQIRSQQFTFILVLLLALAGTAFAFRYMYFSDCELTRFGDRIKWWHGDTLEGAIRTNSCFAIMQDPVFMDSVIMACSCDSLLYRHPEWRGHLFCNADSMPFPRAVDNVRTGAILQYHYYNTPHRQGAVILNGGEAICYEWTRGMPFDTSVNHWTVPISGQVCLFFDYPIWVKGTMEGRLSIGSSHDIGIADNVVYVDANVTPSGGGRVPLSSQNILMLAAGGDIKILNTPANGRNNSNTHGLGYTNLDSCSVFITAALYAAGESFTFEQQNDTDSGYVYQVNGVPHSDDRGTIYLYGSLAQMRRGYVHRSTNTSTGYMKQYRYDPRFREMGAPYEYYDWPNPTRDTLDFGGIPVGHTAWDTAHLYLPMPASLLGAFATTPFYTSIVPPYRTDHFRIPVRFTPTRTGQFSGLLTVNTSERLFQITLRARALPGGGPAPINFDVSPNPFNLTATLRYTLGEPGAVKITIYDVLGRAAKIIDLAGQESGEHSIQLKADDLASGVYFVRLQAGHQTVMKKVLLLK